MQPRCASFRDGQQVPPHAAEHAGAKSDLVRPQQRESHERLLGPYAAGCHFVVITIGLEINVEFQASRQSDIIRESNGQQPGQVGSFVALFPCLDGLVLRPGTPAGKIQRQAQQVVFPFPCRDAQFAQQPNNCGIWMVRQLADQVPKVANSENLHLSIVPRG